MGLRGTQVRKEVRRIVKPVIGTGIKLGKPSVKVDHSRSINKSAERLDGTVRKSESVAEYQRRVLGQIKSSKGEDEPRL